MKITLVSYCHEYSDGSRKLIDISLSPDLITVELQTQRFFHPSYLAESIEDALEHVKDRHGGKAYAAMKKEIDSYRSNDTDIISRCIDQLNLFKSNKL